MTEDELLADFPSLQHEDYSRRTGLRGSAGAAVGGLVRAMKLLLEENLSRRLLKSLHRLYPGSAHVDDVSLHGASDLDVWRFAALHGLTIVSKDDDFRQLSFLHGAPPKSFDWL